MKELSKQEIQYLEPATLVLALLVVQFVLALFALPLHLAFVLLPHSQRHFHQDQRNQETRYRLLRLRRTNHRPC